VFHLLQSLSGHSSGIDSVNFDSSEVLVAAGAASGTIKLWDLEEAKSMLFLPFPLTILMKRDLSSLIKLIQFLYHDFFAQTDDLLCFFGSCSYSYWS